MASLDSDRWSEVQRLFSHAIDLSPGERTAWLGRECPDEDVRREVASLLNHADLGLASVDDAVAAASSAIHQDVDPDLRWIGKRLGAYTIESIVGHGGMGSVYRASRADAQFQHQVAVKLLRPAAQSASTLQRFKQERQILARLEHPNIARLLDGGSTPDGVPYLVMEFIEGDPITDWCNRREWKLDGRLRLFLQVCEAVEFAHQNLVVHRDLKPGNILVTGQGVPKLLDFGIAKMLVPDADAPAVTATGTHVMTPEYASPEQVCGDPLSPRVDVYALGLILYELLTGVRAQKMPDTTPGTIARVVCQAHPPAPGSLNPRLAGDLDSIIRMAIRKEPERRYASAADLARDIQRHLDGRTVTARPDTIPYRVTRFLRRNRVAATTGLLTAVLVGGIALAYWLRMAGQAPHVLRVTQVTQSGHVDPEAKLLTDGSYAYFVETTPGQRRVSRINVATGALQPLLDSSERFGLLDLSPDRKKLLLWKIMGYETALLEMPAGGGELRRIGGVVGHTAAWSPDGKRIAFGRGSAVFIVNSDGSGEHKLLDSPSRVLDLQWAPSSAPAVLRFNIRAAEGHAATLWEVQTDGTHAHPMLADWKSPAGCVHSNDDGSWSAGGKYYLFRSSCESEFSLWAVKDRPFIGRPATTPTLIHSTSSSLYSPVASPDGKRAFYVSAQQRAQLIRYDAGRREFMPYLPGTPVRWISFSQDKQWLAYTTVRPETLWRSRLDGSEAVQLTSLPMRAYFPSWSPDGAWIAFTGYTPKSYGVYAVPSTGGTVQRISPDGSADSIPRWSPDGNFLLVHHEPAAGVAGPQGLFLLEWKTKKLSPVPESESCLSGAWSPDGSRIAAVSRTEIKIFDRRALRWTHLVTGKRLSWALWSRSGRYIYYQDELQPDMPIFRASADGKGIEQMMSSRQIPQSDLTEYRLIALAPDDAPIGSIVRTNSDIYALELELQ